MGVGGVSSQLIVARWGLKLLLVGSSFPLCLYRMYPDHGIFQQSVSIPGLPNLLPGWFLQLVMHQIGLPTGPLADHVKQVSGFIGSNDNTRLQYLMLECPRSKQHGQKDYRA